MDLEEAIEYLKDKLSFKGLPPHTNGTEKKPQVFVNKEAIETVLGALENSIPKKKIEDKKKEIHRNISRIKDEYAIHQNDYIKNKLDSIKNTLQELLEDK